MIRHAITQDIDICVKLAKEFYGEFMIKHGIEMVDQDLYNTIRYFINTGQNLIVERDDGVVGMVAWTVTPHPANVKCRIFQEVLWCCKSPVLSDALLLLREFNREADKIGADVVMLANLSLENESVIRRIYEKMGYGYTESHYAKRRI